ncbi:hypothetical protein SI65_08317 [Aspergillus cristatus]|uniref:C2H2-type domain-containing protein n=1 Tax=Aspergillus cristatus TaxID=573508 RepID=A0A1E3B5U4_ASPCR|nr:hypothetical protein SI65_08317 [Aspergillus cristatus]
MDLFLGSFLTCWRASCKSWERRIKRAFFESGQAIGGIDWMETQESGLLPRLQHREKEIREKFDEEQAFLDIKAQLLGTAVKEVSDDKSALDDTMHPLQLHLVQSLLSYPVSNSLEDEWHRRDTGTAAVVQYCDVLEGGLLRGRPKRQVSASTTLAGPKAEPQDVHQTPNDVDSCEAPVSVDGKPSRATREYLKNAKQPEACFQCFASEGLPDSVRFQMFHDAGCVTRHFDAIHLKEKPLKCNWCELVLLHQMAFQRHAFDVHHVRSRWRCPDPMQEFQK